MPTGYANRLLPALRRVVFVREAADRPDGELLGAFVAERDADAFAVLVRRHGPMVLGVCRRVVGDIHAADDAFQAVFLVLARRAAAVRPRGQVGNWLYGVAYRTAMKARAVLARRRSREKQVDAMPEPPAPATTDPWTDLHPIIDEELARLPDKLRLPVVLCDLEGRPQRAVAKHLGIAPATLAARLASARRLLATRLSRRGIALSGGALAGLLGERASAACVGPGLADSAVRAAEVVAAGGTSEALTSLVSAHAVHLCEGVMRMMMLAKLKAAGACALLALALTGGLGIGLAPARAGDDPVPPPSSGTATAPRPPAPQPPQLVDDATFLRRLCLDLTGTLPTRIEMTYFVGDRTTDKRQKVVGWLVASDVVKAHLAKILGVPVNRIRLIKLLDAANGATVRLSVLVDATTTNIRTTAVAFAPDGKTLFADFDSDGTIDLLNANQEHRSRGVAFTDIDRGGTPDVLVAIGETRSGTYLVGEGINSNSGVSGDVTNVADPAGRRSDIGLLQDLTSLTVPVQYKKWLVVADPPAQSPQVAKPAPAGGQSQDGGSLLFYNMEYSVPLGDTDIVFLRRVIEQVRNAPPTALEEKYFTEDKDPKKREKLLDLLLKDATVAKKLGDDWKKKMLEPPATPTLTTFLTTITNPPDAQNARLWRIAPSSPHPWNAYQGLTVTVVQQSDRTDKLIGELFAAKKTDEQVLEAVTLAVVGRLPTDGEKRLTLAAVSKAADRKAAWVEVAKALAGSPEAKAHAAPASPPTSYAAPASPPAPYAVPASPPAKP
jgi:RNA polymerase sigma factor (sigma-70 family)